MRFPISMAAVAALLLVAPVVPAAAETPAAGTDISGKPVFLRRLSVLRHSDSYTGKIYTLTTATLQVTGRGVCNAGWCPLTHNGVQLFARRNHIDLAQPPGGGPVVTERTLRPGDEGDDVRAIQEVLIKKGAKIQADGRMGPATVQAVREFQRKNGLAPDGAVGPETRKRLVG